MRIGFITGVNSGFGRELARQFTQTALAASTDFPAGE